MPLILFDFHRAVPVKLQMPIMVVVSLVLPLLFCFVRVHFAGEIKHELYASCHVNGLLWLSYRIVKFGSIVLLWLIEFIFFMIAFFANQVELEDSRLIVGFCLYLLYLCVKQAEIFLLGKLEKSSI